MGLAEQTDHSFKRLAEHAHPIARHFAGRLGIARNSIAPNDMVFLIWLYEQLRGEWEV